MAVLLALSAALAWGVSDFVGGVASRRIGVLTVLLLVELGGLAVITLVAVAVQPGPLGATNAFLALAAGLVGVAGLALFYRALAIGTMSVVAPISATGVALPVLVGVVGGERPATVQWAGIVLIVFGVMLASREQSTVAAEVEANRRSVLLALLAGLCFGGFFALSAGPSEESVLWTVLMVRIAPVPVVIVLWLRSGARLPERKLGATLVVAGTIDLAATSLIALANSKGDLSVVSVVASMYPVVTVMLAAVVLHERLLRSQYFGVVLALLGIAAVAGG